MATRLRVQTRLGSEEAAGLFAGVGDHLEKTGSGTASLDSWVLQVLKRLESGLFSPLGSIWRRKCQITPPQIARVRLLDPSAGFVHLGARIGAELCASGSKSEQGSPYQGSGRSSSRGGGGCRGRCQWRTRAHFEKARKSSAEVGR